MDYNCDFLASSFDWAENEGANDTRIAALIRELETRASEMEEQASALGPGDRMRAEFELASAARLRLVADHLLSSLGYPSNDPSGDDPESPPAQ